MRIESTEDVKDLLIGNVASAALGTSLELGLFWRLAKKHLDIEAEPAIQKIKDDVAALKEDFNQLRQGVLGKINEYDTNMRDVGSELKAVQKVFKDVIPKFTENVAELSRVSKTIKKK